MLVSHLPPSEVAAKIAVSLGIGLLVGIEREWSNKDLGARTFALTALLGTIAALFEPSIAGVSMIGVFLIVIFANVRSLLVDRSLEATTSAALLVIYVLGAMAGQGHLFTPVAAAILMAMLLAWKVELHRFAGGLQPAEIRSAVLLGLLGLVVYPILPDRFIDRWELVNPQQAWITVIVIAGIGLNVNQEKFTGELGAIATSLRIETGKPQSRLELLVRLLREFENDYNQFLREGAASITKKFAGISSYAQGKRVRVTNGTESFAGTTAGLGPEGLLRVKRDDGEVVTVIAGDVTEAR